MTRVPMCICSTIRGLQWRILIQLSDNVNDRPHVHMYVQCEGDGNTTEWSCRAKVGEQGVADKFTNTGYPTTAVRQCRLYDRPRDGEVRVQHQRRQ
ncbi:unnamed protein product [Sphagnum balticum]